MNLSSRNLPKMAPAMTTGFTVETSALRMNCTKNPWNLLVVQLLLVQEIQTLYAKIPILLQLHLSCTINIWYKITIQILVHILVPRPWCITMWRKRIRKRKSGLTFRDKSKGSLHTIHMNFCLCWLKSVGTLGYSLESHS